MATTKPRITITIEPEHNEVLRRLVALKGGSKAAVVSGLVASIAPSLQGLCELLEAAAAAQSGVQDELRRAAEVADAEMRPLAAAATAQFRAFGAALARISEAAERTEAGPPSSNHGGQK